MTTVVNDIRVGHYNALESAGATNYALYMMQRGVGARHWHCADIQKVTGSVHTIL